MKSEAVRSGLNGVFAVYKPKGLSSRTAVSKVQHILTRALVKENNPCLGSLGQTEIPVVRRKDRLKVGHGGTLDPIAEGVLVLGVGSGCKDLNMFLKGTKEYEVEVAFGQATDTYDSEGKVTNFGSIDGLSVHKVQDALEAFKGNVWQVPPIYSALHMDGRRLYDYARKGASLPRPIKAREVEIGSIELTGFDDGKCILKVGCGGGTYMRSLVNDLGIALGCYAHMTGLKRSRQGQWTWEDALPIEEGVLDLAAVRSILRSPTYT